MCYHKQWQSIFIYLLMIVTLLLWVRLPIHTYAQNEPSPNEQMAAYWQYDAAGEITQFLAIDLYADQFIETVLLTNDQQVDLINPAGQPLWSQPIVLEETVIDIAFVNIETEIERDDRSFGFNIGRQTKLTPSILLLTATSVHAYDAIDRSLQWIHPFDDDQHALQTIMPLLSSVTEGKSDIILVSDNGHLTRYQLESDGMTERWQWQPVTRQAFVAAHILADTLLAITQTGDPNKIIITPINLVTGEGSEARSISGSYAASTVVPMFNTPSVAIGTVEGMLHLLDEQLADRWQLPRTLHHSITALTATIWQDKPIFIAGTMTGKIIGWQENGGRLWDQAICQIEGEIFSAAPTQCVDGVAGSVKTILTPAQSTDQVAVELIVDQTSHTLVLNDQFDVTAQYAAAEQPILIDTNQDNITELLTVNFGTLTTAPTGTSLRNTRELWQYRLGSKPRQAIAYTRPNHAPELLLAAGKSVHLITTDIGSARWVESFNGDVAHIGLLKQQSNTVDLDSEINSVIVGYNVKNESNNQSLNDLTGFVELINDDGDKIADFSLSTTGGLTAVALTQRTINDYWLLLGTDRGFIYAYRLIYDEDEWQHRLLWERHLENPITAISVLEANSLPQFVVATSLDLRRLDIVNGSTVYNVNVLDRENDGNTCKFPLDLIYVLENGLDTATCLGNPVNEWRDNLGSGRIMRRIETAYYRYSPLNQSTWRQVTSNTSEELASPLLELDNVTDFVVEDMTNDNVFDVVLADTAGNLLLDLNTDTPQIINYSSGIIAIETVQEAGRESPGLAVVVGNSLVHFLRFLPNNPPLITSPIYDPDASTIQIVVQDIEQSPIEVFLEIRDEANASWIQQGNSQIADKGNTNLTWVMEKPSSDQFEYRFTWQEGLEETAEKTILLPIKAQQTTTASFLSWFLILGFVLAYAAWYGFRRVQIADWQGVRLYRHLRQERTTILQKLREKYKGSSESADWLLRLSSRARRRNDPTIAALSDGLFLLENPSNAGIPILREILQLIDETQKPAWDEVNEWQQMLAVTDLYLKTSTLQELSLLDGELMTLVELAQSSQFDVYPFLNLHPIFTTLQAAETAENVDDRLLYLEDSLVQLRDITIVTKTSAPGLPHVLVGLVLTRWMGLINAETEDIRGRARVVSKLISTQIIPDIQNSLVLELHNVGRASAENVHISLDLSDKTLPINTPIQLIPALPSHRSRRVTFPVTVPQADTFRVLFTIRYNDRTGDNHIIEYANMVNVLQSPDQFEPVINPYAPGTPLQKNSRMFFGRTSLFNFITEQAPRLAQQRVLILVGQRRTGKTSALLRLGRHLPNHLIPIYIDCQALGALPGEAGFFQDIVWQVEDAMMDRGIDFLAPDLDATKDNPLTWFKRDFIPSIRKNISADTTLVLVFDEFEAFENLVDDGILPRAIFGHLRHLMQHCEGVSFVFVGTHRLEEMTAGYWSVLFNIALYKEIEYLNEGASHALVTQPVAPSIRYDALALDRIWKITAGHPYFLQLVCYSLIKRANHNKTGYITVSDVNGTIDEMLALGEVHFAYIWQFSNPIERIILVVVSHLLNHDESFRAADIINLLKPYGVRLSPAQITTALDHLVQRNIMQEVSKNSIISHKMKIGLVSIWVESTRTLNQLYNQTI